MKSIPLRHIILPRNEDLMSQIPDHYSVAKIAAHVADLTDNAIVSAIVRTAAAEGITDLYLMDKGFVLSALLEEIKRLKPKTNADRIRAMTDEELCKFLYSHKFFDMCEEGCSECSYVGDCESRLAEWLKQPVEGGAE